MESTSVESLPVESARVGSTRPERTRRRPLAAALLALLALPPAPLCGHELTEGVGTQTTFRLHPDRIEIELNLGFSASAGLPVLIGLDANGDDRVDAAEAERLIAERGPALLPFLDLRVNGRPTPLEIRSGEEVGVRGAIVTRSFDLYYQVVAPLPAELPDGGWWLHYRDGSFEGLTSSQYCWVPFEGHEVGHVRIFAPLAIPQDVAFRTAGREFVLFADDVFRPEMEPGAAAIPAVEALAAIPLAGAPLPGNGDAASAPIPRVSEPLPRAAAEGEEAGEEEQMGEIVRALAKGERRGVELLLTLLLAVVLGAAHALGPGHGKSMVAAYLVGSRGRVRDAITLGAVVTFAHTASIFILGLVLLWLIERSADKVASATYQNWLTTGFSMLSGVLLLSFGLVLLRRRLRVARGLADPHGHERGHGHSHEHGHSHGHRWWQHSHPHLGGHSHGHSHGPGHHHGHEATGVHAHTHSHGPGHSHSHSHAHSHAHGDAHGHDPSHEHDHDHEHEHDHEHDHDHDHGTQGEERPAVGERVRFGDLVALGLSGGIVPCPAGFTIVLVAAHYQALALGLLLLTFFSFGLGALLCGIGVALVLGKERILDRFGTRSGRVMRWLPVASAALVAAIGVYFMWDSYRYGRSAIAQMLQALGEKIGG